MIHKVSEADVHAMFDTESVRGSTHITFRKANKMHIHPTVIPGGVFHSWPKLYVVPSIIYPSTVFMYSMAMSYTINTSRVWINQLKKLPILLVVS